MSGAASLHTSPTTPPTLTRSPTLNARRYVIAKPAIMFEMTYEEPRENTTPRKRETPLNASEPEP